MCGILGVTTKKEYKPSDIEKMVGILFKLSESRGKEATGLAVKTKESIDVIKLPFSVSDFLKNVFYKEFSKKIFAKGFPISIIGHARLATHGTEINNENNQPVVKDKAVCVHNGIIANDEKLWQSFPELKRNYQVDTEVFLSLFQKFFAETGSLTEAAKKTFESIEGSASVAVLFNNNPSLLLTTNTGSLYFLHSQDKETLVFASERYILEEFSSKAKDIDSFKLEEIRQIKPNTVLIADTGIVSAPESKIVSHSAGFSAAEVSINENHFELSSETKKSMEETRQNLYSLYDEGKIRRCAKCLLPETMTFIDFDEQGVCNYCRNHKKIEVKGAEALESIVSKFRRSDGRPNCIIGFSGGRDSSYGLHYIKKVLKMNPVAYTYDWGVLTDLGRRNQARVCGKLGVEHIIISADIREKRRNVLLNLNAWLKKPKMGMIPILMAGDKKHIYCGEILRNKMGIKLVIQSCGNGLENELFKIGLAGVRMPQGEEATSKIPIFDKMKVTAYYAYQYLRNPAYFNLSLVDTFLSYYYNFIQPEDRLNLYNYIQWDEKEILSTISREYNWEREPDTVATWRIDDGTAAFYNYIYLAVMGLTEFDTFRSIQIREGQISRKDAQEIAKMENAPRYESIEWYGKTIGFDVNKVIEKINGIPKFYLRK